METTAEELCTEAKIEYIFGSMLLDPRVQRYLGADDRIVANPDINKVAITAQYIGYALEDNDNPTCEDVRKLRDETRTVLG